MCQFSFRNIDFIADTFSTEDNNGLLTSELIRPGGPCEERGVTPYAIATTAGAVIPVSSSETRFIDFSEPYCIAFTGSIDNGSPEGGYVLSIMDSPLGSSIGFLELSTTAITFSLGEAVATFGGSFAADPIFHHLQICVSNNVATLYTGCESPQQVPFSTSVTLGPLSVISFFQNSSIDNSQRFEVYI